MQPSSTPRRGARAGLVACLLAAASLLVPALAVAPPPGSDKPPGAHRDDWPECRAGFFNRDTIGRKHHGIAGGMQIRVVWQNQSYFTGLPVTLHTDGADSDHWLTPRQTVTEWGTVHFVFGDMRKYPEFVWSLSADSPSSAVLLSYRVYAPRCQGSDT